MGTVSGLAVATTGPKFRYAAFGLVVESSFELPELDLLSNTDAQTDIFVSRSEARISSTVSTSRDTRLPPPLITLESAELAFQINEGRRIDVWEADGFDREFTRAALLGVGFSAALYQRGDWPLHVSAVVSESGVWLFGGRSGAGKSTMAALLHVALGYPLVSDDSGVVRFDGEVVRFSAASRAIRLLPDALPYTFHRPDSPAHLAAPIPAIDRKVRIRLTSRHPSAQLTVRGLVMLDDLSPGEKSRVEVLRGARALEAVRVSMYRPWLGQYMCSAADALRFCAEFQRRVPVYSFSRHRSFDMSLRDLDPLRALMSVDAV